MNSKKHPWEGRRLKIIDQKYLGERGISIDKIDPEILTTLEKASEKAIQIFNSIGGKPPLLRFNQELETQFVPIPKDLKLELHGNTTSCPANILEVVPAPGCQINCQYCLAIAQNQPQTKVQVYQDYSQWFAQQLKTSRDSQEKDRGIMYYLSPKTEIFSPQMVKLGIAQEILETFFNHIQEKTKTEGQCKDTLFIITKAGYQELDQPGPDGKNILELFQKMPDHIQINISLAPLGNNPDLREALEPGARSKEDRLEFMRALQKNKILASGALAEPIFFPFALDKSFYQELKQVGIKRVALDLLTSTYQNLVVVNQIIGWFDPEAEKKMWQAYLTTDAPPKKGGRYAISLDHQQQVYTKVFNLIKEIGIEAVVYCRFAEMNIKLGLAEYQKGGCMAYVDPKPEIIKRNRI